MTESLPFAIALWTGAFTVAGYVAGGTAIHLADQFRNRRLPALADLAGKVLALAAVVILPLSIVSVAGLAAAALVEALRTPPIAFPFAALAGLASLAATSKMPSGGMEGCNKVIGLFLAIYAVVWAAVAWWVTGGLSTLETDVESLRWLQPPLAALPFSVLLWWIAGDKRSLRLFLGSLAFFSAYFALLFFSIESGFADRWLPENDWLRFPLASLAGGLLLVLLPVAANISRNSRRRMKALRELPRQAMFWAALTLPAGLAWAGARTFVSIL